jgi:hypothetical protein
MVFRIDNLGMRLRWVVILLVPENRYDVGDCTLRKFWGLPNCSRSGDELSARFWRPKGLGNGAGHRVWCSVRFCGIAVLIRFIASGFINAVFGEAL